MDVLIVSVVAVLAIGVVAVIAIASVGKARSNFAERELVRVLDRLMSSCDLSLDARSYEMQERQKPAPPATLAAPGPDRPNFFDGISIPGAEDAHHSNGMPVN